MPSRSGDELLSGSFVTRRAPVRQRPRRSAARPTPAQLAEEASRFTLVSSELRNGINTILKVITYLLVPAAVADHLEPVPHRRAPTIDEALRRHGRRAGADGARGPGAADQHRVRGRRGAAGPPAVPGAGAAGDRGAGPRRRRVRRQDRHPHRERDAPGRGAPLRRARRGGPAARRSARSVAADPRPNASLAAVARALHATRAGRSRRPSRSPRPASGAVRASVRRGDALAARRPGRAAARAAARSASAAERGSARGGLRVLLLVRARPTVRRTTISPARSSRPRWWCWSSGCGREAAGTLAYFAEQDVEVKVISGDNPRLGRGGRRHRSALPARRRPRRRPRRCPPTASRWPTRWRPARCSAGSRPRRSGTWWARCSPAGTPWR